MELTQYVLSKKNLEKELPLMFIMFYFVKPLLVKITKLWILSCYIHVQTIHLFMFGTKQKNSNFVWAYTFFEV